MPRYVKRRLSNQVDLNLLELFEATYRHRNMTVAGAELGLSQPAMSRALARLRDAYDDPLFVRTPQGLMPTPFGDRLFESACSALEIVRRTLENATFDPLRSNRTFRIAMSDTGEQLILPRLARGIAAEAPAVRLHALQIPATELLVALATGKVDLALGYFQLGPEGMYRQRLFEAPYACVARAVHPGIQDHLSLGLYRSLGHVVTSFNATAHAEKILTLLTAPPVSARIAMYVSHFLSIGPIVAGTDYIATVPRNLAESFVSAWGLQVHALPITVPSYDVSQYWHARFHQEPGLAWLRKRLKSLIAIPDP